MRVETQYAPARCTPVAAVRSPDQLPPIPYACVAQRALLPIAVSAMNINELMNINDVRESATTFPRPCKLTFDLLTLKVVSEARVKWAICVPILGFLVLSVLELFPMYATDRRQTSDRRQTKLLYIKASLNAPLSWRGHNNTTAIRSAFQSSRKLLKLITHKNYCYSA